MNDDPLFRNPLVFRLYIEQLGENFHSDFDSLVQALDEARIMWDNDMANNPNFFSMTLAVIWHDREDYREVLYAVPQVPQP